jgi:hypothetical protein
MHGNSKFKLTQQLIDAQRGLEMQLERDPSNDRMVEYYKKEISRLTKRVYGV